MRSWRASSEAVGKKIGRRSWEGSWLFERSRPYGDATPVVVETLKTGTVLDRTEVQERMLELDIAIVEEHELTLPPASFPWDEFDRRDQVWERTQDIKRFWVERNLALRRRWLRRVFTLGLWRN